MLREELRVNTVPKNDPYPESKEWHPGLEPIPDRGYRKEK